jgi:hypothetical protein
VKGPTGQFCGEECKERHEKFVSRAQELQRTSRGIGVFTRIKSALIKFAVTIVAVAFLGFFAVYFNIPVLGDLVRNIMDFLSRFMPFL